MVIDQKDQTLFKYDYFIIEPNGGYERSAHVHRCTSYVAELHKKNWAYKNRIYVPKLKNSVKVMCKVDYINFINKIHELQ
tara:strand:+ start:44 stop:283 length:240 start_codon:yes stop_codon:yes gene_type:complete